MIKPPECARAETSDHQGRWQNGRRGHRPRGRPRWSRMGSACRRHAWTRSTPGPHHRCGPGRVESIQSSRISLNYVIFRVCHPRRARARLSALRPSTWHVAYPRSPASTNACWRDSYPSKDCTGVTCIDSAWQIDPRTMQDGNTSQFLEAAVPPSPSSNWVASYTSSAAAGSSGTSGICIFLAAHADDGTKSCRRMDLR